MDIYPYILDDVHRRIKEVVERHKAGIKERVSRVLNLSLSGVKRSKGSRQYLKVPIFTLDVPESIKKEWLWKNEEFKDILLSLYILKKLTFYTNEAQKHLEISDDVLKEIHVSRKLWEESLKNILQISNGLLEYHFEKIRKILDEIYKSNKDILGAYFFVRDRRIEIYSKPIALVAVDLDVSIEALTVVVLIHEIVHLYSHLGADSDGNVWKDMSFDAADSKIVEGIAQFFTEKIVEEMDDDNIRLAFNKLLEKQPHCYKIHREWIKQRVSNEAVRATIIGARKMGLVMYEDFESLMKDISKKFLR